MVLACVFSRCRCSCISNGWRSAFLLLISTLIIITCIKRFKILRLITFILSSIIIIIITLNVPLVKERNIDYTISQLGMMMVILMPSLQSIKILQNIDEMFLDSHSLDMELNVQGYCQAKYKIHEITCNTHPHNTYYNYLLRLVFWYIAVILVLLIICYKFMASAHSITASTNRYLNNFQVSPSCWVLLLWPLLTLNFFNN